MVLIKFYKLLKQKFPDKLPDLEFPNKLPDSDSSLNKKILYAVIVKISNAIIAVIKASAKPRGSYAYFIPTVRFEIGMCAEEHDITATTRYYEKRFPELALIETTVRCTCIKLRICT